MGMCEWNVDLYGSSIRLFLMGIMKYGRGRWMQIAEELVQTKDPKQVEEHAELVFKSFQLSTSEAAGDTTSTDKMTRQQYQHQNPMFTTHPSADSSVRQVMFVPPSPALAAALPRPTMIMYPIAPSHNPGIWQAGIVSNAPSSSASNTDITNKMMIQQRYQVPPPPPSASPQPNDGSGIDLELRLGRDGGEMEEPLMYRWL
ncbi:hypothetical protein K2173_005038 [Erythroxylum novogranatense]|uniref:SANT domain-containing protein n=1 Tax=Erythroxylum novogranatense TaxID=1862640 RepID=A0AAV8TCM9_9ROSI|nr:hypothetical protein K2173_005038 [Erythroxylum novogranatense]